MIGYRTKLELSTIVRRVSVRWGGVGAVERFIPFFAHAVSRLSDCMRLCRLQISERLYWIRRGRG